LTINRTTDQFRLSRSTCLPSSHLYLCCCWLY